ncbi:Metalloendoproteinase 5-MMP [Arachis hypogaea]|nr:Metalloendoproteinase 5-MMP [Arachis hypogaea]
MIVLLLVLLANPLIVHSRILRSSSDSNVHSQRSFDSIDNQKSKLDAEAVAGARRYLKEFGYLQEQDHDDFEGAIKKFQKYYNLEVSGKLDSQTNKIMSMPRCGIPDHHRHLHHHLHRHHRGFSKNLLKVTSKYAFSKDAPSWPNNKRNLTYSFDPSGVSVVPQETVREAFKLAFSKWSQVSPFTFKETRGYSDIAIGFYSGEHGDGVTFNNTIVAHAYPPIDGRLHVNADKGWSIKDPIQEDKNIHRGDTYDLVWVAMHEIGHILGLDHSNDEDAIMYPFIAPLKNKRAFVVDDVTGIQELYSLGVQRDFHYPSAMGFRLQSYHLLIVAIFCLWVMYIFLSVMLSVFLD